MAGPLVVIPLCSFLLNPEPCYYFITDPSCLYDHFGVKLSLKQWTFWFELEHLLEHKRSVRAFAYTFFLRKAFLFVLLESYFCVKTNTILVLNFWVTLQLNLTSEKIKKNKWSQQRIEWSSFSNDTRRKGRIKMIIIWSWKVTEFRLFLKKKEKSKKARERERN